jgi:hypothetical protein
MATMVVKDMSGEQPPEYAAALREEQRRGLQKYLAYAKKVLNAGVRGRS